MTEHIDTTLKQTLCPRFKKKNFCPTVLLQIIDFDMILSTHAR